jgi:hypothetical protein
MSQGLASRWSTATGGRRTLKRFALAASLAALWLAAGATPAAASVTLGQLGPNTATCVSGQDIDVFQASVASGNGYQVPATGTITSWSNNSAPGTGQSLTFKVFRKVNEPNVYAVVGHDGPRPLRDGVLSTFPASIPVQAGDLIGYNTLSSAGTSCTIPLSGVAGNSVLSTNPGLADGDSRSFSGASSNLLNLTAVFVPSNAVTVGKTALNKKKGTATLNLTVPNPGELTGSGKGVKAAAAGAATSKAVTAGAAQLLIKAKGKKKKQLKQKGKVKLNVIVTYTPTGGDPSTQSKRLKLKLNTKLRRR